MSDQNDRWTLTQEQTGRINAALEETQFLLVEDDGDEAIITAGVAAFKRVLGEQNDLYAGMALLLRPEVRAKFEESFGEELPIDVEERTGLFDMSNNLPVVERIALTRFLLGLADELDSWLHTTNRGQVLHFAIRVWPVSVISKGAYTNTQKGLSDLIFYGLRCDCENGPSFEALCFTTEFLHGLLRDAQ